MKTILTDEKDKQFLKLVEELDYGYYLNIGDELEKYREYNEFKTPHIVILMMDDDEAIACASYRASDEKSVEFKRVYVKKQYRKKGIASDIIKELEKDAIETVMEEGKCSRVEAIMALRAHNGDPVEFS